jgi:hypothetical protein
MTVKFTAHKHRIAALMLLFSLFTSAYTLLPLSVQAESSEITQVYNVSDKDAKEGDLLSFDQTGINRSSTSYDIHLFGILQASPLAVFKRVDESGQPIVRNGVIDVNVTNLNGPIAEGDYITSSEIPGLGMKANLSGYVLGIALAAFNDSDGQSLQFKDKTVRSGKIQVAVKVEYAELSNPRSVNRLFEYLGTAFFRNVQDPQGFGQIIKYGTAGLIILFSFLFGLIILTRSMPKAIEAIGRNPLAKRTIQISIGLNIAFAVIIAIVGIIAALIILRL